MSFKKTAAMLGVALAICASGAQAQSYHTLYRFKGDDGAKPVAPLIVDNAGNLYGVTELGGANNSGTVFRLSAGKSETILHSFAGASQDGCGPWEGLTSDGEGDLFGTTVSCGPYGQGITFEITPDGSEHLLHAFGYPMDGKLPMMKPLLDAAGNLFGVTYSGGTNSDPVCREGCGTIYRITPDGTETLLHSFAVADGALPNGELIADGAGNLYGTTTQGGSRNGGTVFKLAPNGTLTTLYSFTDNAATYKDRLYSPSYGLVRDAAGNLYGVASMWRAAHDKKCPDRNCGAVYMLTPQGKLHILHAFTGGGDGAMPNSTLAMDAAGSLYGTTQHGGNRQCQDGLGCGTVFRYSPDGSMAILHAFTARQGMPNGVTLGAGGALYGAAFRTEKTSGDGLVFRIDQ